MVILLIIGFLLGNNTSSKSNTVLNPTLDSARTDSQIIYKTEKRTGTKNEQTGECYENIGDTDRNSFLVTLPEYIKNNEVAKSVLRDNCLFSMQNGFFDVTGDGMKDILMITEALDCVTCRATRLIIISDNKVIVDKSVENAIIREVENNNLAFEIKEPIYFNSTGMCCPTKGTVKLYEYRGDNYLDFDMTPVFARIDEYIENYQIGGDPVFNERKEIY